jgi:hypothetical protein
VVDGGLNMARLEDGWKEGEEEKDQSVPWVRDVRDYGRNHKIEAVPPPNVRIQAVPIYQSRWESSSERVRPQ